MFEGKMLILREDLFESTVCCYKNEIYDIYVRGDRA